MEVSATHRYIRIAPRKLALLAGEVRGKDINDALDYLKMSPRRQAAEIISGVLNSAVANAEHKGTVDVDTLVVKTLLVGQAPTLKRFRPRAKGAASKILKRASHLTVSLAER